jgi:hypothetical protein
MRQATRTLSWLAALLAVGLVMGAAAHAAGMPEPKSGAAPGGKPDTPSKLDLIKKLQGDWVEVGPDGKPTNKVVSTYRVTAGGSAVEETLMAGTDHEMVTLYHMDGDVLMLTHYCVAGNQPRMRAEAQTDPHTLVFRCAGATNMKSENDRHMHQATIVWKDDNHIHSDWEMVENGKNVMTASFELARR